MREKLNSELKKSIINKDLAATKTIRLIIAAIKDRDIVVRTEGNQNGISEADIISLLKKMKIFQSKLTFHNSVDSPESLLIVLLVKAYQKFIINTPGRSPQIPTRTHHAGKNLLRIVRRWIPFQQLFSFGYSHFCSSPN